MSLKSRTHPDLVITGEDHKPFKPNAFCPIFCHKSLLTTWTDPTTFLILPIEPSQLRRHLAQLIPPILLEHYPWGISLQAQPPTGQVLLKAKKDFLQGRAILNYKFAIMSKLLKATAMVLNEIIHAVWTDAMGLTPMPNTFQSLRTFLDHLPPHRQDDPSTHYTHINDDLVGFFNALPQHQILTDYENLIDTYLRLTGNHLPTTTFTVELSQKQTSLHRVHAGTVTYSSKATHNLIHCKTIHLAHVRTIIETLFTTGVVKVMRMCLKQIQGSTIGNQISPTLCAIPIITRELQWKKSYQDWYNNHKSQFFLERYVDNRFGIIPKHPLTHPAMTEFTQ